MKHKGTITLETERLLLRRFEVEDAEAVFNNYASDPEVTKFLRWPTHTDIEAPRKWCRFNIKSYEDDSYYNWIIVLKSLGESIGSIGADIQNARIGSVDVGYNIGKAWWRHGYASEALEAVVRFLIEDIGANRIQAWHDPNNPHSGKVMEKVGMRYEGTLRQADHSNQGICDCIVYALLAEDYYAARCKDRAGQISMTIIE
jgi:ribosomal-protein-alanine N-acetyltransferase